MSVYISPNKWVSTSLEWAQVLLKLATGESDKVPTDKEPITGAQRYAHINRGMVLHREANVVGIVVGVHLPGEYKSPINGEPVTAHVLELDGGHTFVFNGDAPAEGFMARFHHLTKREAHFLLMMVGTVDEFITGAARLGAAMRLDPALGRDLVVSVLERATRALKTAPVG